MIELAMIFTFGILLASLAWLTILPFVSRRAVRLAARKLRLKMPASAEEIIAERDRLRARHAVAIRQLEQAGEALNARVAGLMSEAGRHATSLVLMTDKTVAAQAEIARVQAELRQTALGLIDAQGTLGTQMIMLHEAYGLADRRLALLNAATARLSVAEGTIDEQRATIAGLETRTTGHELRLQTAETESAALIARLKAAEQRIEHVSGDLDIARADVALMTARRDRLQARVDGLLTALTQTRGEPDSERGPGTSEATDTTCPPDAIAGLSAHVAAQNRQIAEGRRHLREAEAQRDAVQAERDSLIAFQSRINDIVSRDWGTSDASALSFVASKPPAEGEDLSVLRATISSLAADLVRHATTTELT